MNSTIGLSSLVLLISCRWAAPQLQEEKCECVPLYLCKKDGAIDINGEVSTCENPFSKCCKPSDQHPTAAPPAAGSQKKCGQRNFVPLHSDDSSARIGEYPWMVAILAPSKLNLCGGALIHPQIVLTAAHCIDNYTENSTSLTVRAGDWDLQWDYEVPSHQDRRVRSVIVHANFSMSALLLGNDFGLVILSEPVHLDAINVGLVCLPQTGDNYDDSRCFTSGWGKNRHSYLMILQHVQLAVVPREQCQSTLRTTRLKDRFLLHDSFICAAGEAGKNNCRGDGGSPLVCPMKANPKRFVQAGIVSWSIGCGENLIPTVFANVAAGRAWINEQTAKAGFDISEYQSV